MDHSQLIAELPRIEKLTAAERLKIARDRRATQLRIYEQHERDVSSKNNKQLSNQRVKKRSKNRNIKFVHSVMLLEAAARNDIDEVRRLLMQGVSPDSTNEDGLTALHQCCIDDSDGMMKLLIEFGANVNAEDSEKWTPLHAAATCGHLHLVKFLISKNANLLAVNADGNMPYDICEDEPTLDYIESEMARRGVTQELIDQTRASTERQMLTDLKQMAARGEGLEFRDHVGATPLHIAAANGYLSVVEFLLDQHVATDLKDNDGWQPIHAAACWGHLEVLELLVQNGADLNAQTKNHETPYDICEDPELKNRIAALRTEQEIRARADHQKNRRPQSTAANTRTHSIRRNSTRDKGLTSKKQIKNEAIIGIQIDDTDNQQVTKLPSTDQRSSSPTEREMDTEVGSGDTTSSSRLQTSQTGSSTNGNGKRPAPPPPVTKHSENGNVNNSKEIKSTHFGSPQIVTASALSDNKIDIHVSVTINTHGSLAAPSNLSPAVLPLPAALTPVPSLSGVSCTLADLKKHRSQSRHLVVASASSAPHLPFHVTNSQSPFLFPAAECKTSSENNSPVPASLTNVITDNEVKRLDGVTSNANTTTSQPVSTLPKFQGETAELVGSNKSQTPCCVIL